MKPQGCGIGDWLFWSVKKLLESTVRKLEKLKSQIQKNISKYLDAEEKSNNEFNEKNPDLALSFNRSQYDYVVRINEDKECVSILFDGGMFYALINTHFIVTGEDFEDYIEESWFCEKTAERIFDLSKYDWSPYASYQLDVRAN